MGGGVPPWRSEAMRRGLLFNLQRFSLHDGPGIRTTVFLKGCALSCSWCHNPESQAPDPEVMVSADRCIRCGACVEACAADVPVPGGGRGAEAVDLCSVCGACVEACPSGARQIAGREIDVSSLVEELLRDRIFFDQSGGGATFKPTDHLSTTVQCDVCHSTTSWAPDIFQHDRNGDYPGDHRVNPGCITCHRNGINATFSWRYSQYQPFCAACHANDFSSESDHIGGRSGTVEQNKNCGQSGCHSINDRNWD